MRASQQASRERQSALMETVWCKALSSEKESASTHEQTRCGGASEGNKGTALGSVAEGRI